MDQSIENMHKLLQEIAQHLQSVTKTDNTAAVAKLSRLVAIASTLSLTVKAARR